jgi:hypothetical protein
VKLGTTLAQGTYTVAWRVISSDTHPVHGAFVFSIGQASGNANAIANRALASQQTPRWVSVGFGVVRFLDFALVLLIAGGAAALAVVVPGPAPRLRRALAEREAIRAAAPPAAGAVHGRVGRDLERRPPAGLEDARHVPGEGVVVPDVLDHLDGGDAVEGRVGQRRPGHVVEHDRGDVGPPARHLCDRGVGQSKVESLLQLGRAGEVGDSDQSGHAHRVWRPPAADVQEQAWRAAAGERGEIAAYLVVQHWKHGRGQAAEVLVRFHRGGKTHANTIARASAQVQLRRSVGPTPTA